MANGTTHLALGAVTGLLISMLANKNHETNCTPAVGVGIGAFFGKLPDILEPALHPHHRQLCHSWLVAGSIGYGLVKIYEWQPEDHYGHFLRSLALIAGGAYISHLLLDATTPRSLPLFGKV